MTTRPIQSIQDLLSIFEEDRIAKWSHAHIRFWFRGHSNVGWKLVPGVYRPSFKAVDEEERLNIEQNLTMDFRIQSSGLRIGRNTNAEIYFLQQHYRMPTRLLDWTTNPLAALFFAVTDVQQDASDGELFRLDAYQFRVQKPEDKTFYGIGSQRNPYFVHGLRPTFEGGKVEDFPPYIFAVRPDYMDTRINSQSSCFTFHVPDRPELSISENDRLLSYRIPAAAKDRLRNELSLLGVDPFSIFGDLEGLASRLLRAYRI
jgi:FRG domain-containing protein